MTTVSRTSVIEWEPGCYCEFLNFIFTNKVSSLTELPVRHFTTLEELGDLLIKDWVAVIDLLYPPIDPHVFSSTESEVFRQWSVHEAFAVARRQVFVRTPRIREMVEVLSLHAEVKQGIKRRSSMVVPTAVLGTFMTSLPGSEKETLPPVLVLAGMRKKIVQSCTSIS